MSDLSLRQIIEQSATRAARWHADSDPWSILEWAGAMAGEAGEACNAAKKLKRLLSQMKNLDKRKLFSPAVAQSVPIYKQEVAKEVADTILYGICVANALEIDLIPVLVYVFNEKSIEYDFPERIG